MVIFAVVLAVTVLLAYQIRNYGISWDIRAGLSDEDPELKILSDFRDKFGEAELMVAIIEADNIFSESNLIHIQKLTNQISGIESVKNVFSISNAPYFSNVNGELNTSPFLTVIPDSDDGLKKLQTVALSNEDWVGSIVSADGKFAAINMLLADKSHDIGERLKTVQSVRKALSHTTSGNLKIFLTGISPIADESRQVIQKDLTKFLWLTPIITLVFLFPVFGTIAGVMVPAIVIMLSQIWIFGIFFWLGGKISAPLTILPTLISVICLSDIIHITTCYLNKASLESNKIKAVVFTMEEMIPVCFLTSLTTAVGFGALVFSNLKAVSQFGMLAAAGILIAYFLSMLLVPIALTIVPFPKVKVPFERFQAAITYVLTRTSLFVKKEVRLITTATVLLTLFSVAGAMRLQAQTHISQYLPNSSESITGMEKMKENLHGFSTLEISCAGQPGDFRKTRALKELDKIHMFLATLPGVDKSFSLVNILRRADRILGDNKGEVVEILDHPGRIAEYIFYFTISNQSHLLNSFVTNDYSSARISTRLQPMGTDEQLKIVSRLESFLQGKLDKGLEFHVTGALKLYATQSMNLVRNISGSLGISVLFISLLLIIYLRSIPMGLLSMVPNILPILFCLGFMGWFEISIDIVTIMITCIAIAIAVDDTIHFLSRYKKNLRDGKAPHVAIEETIFLSGRAIIYTSLVIALGCSLFIFSSFLPNRYFGFFMVFIMFSALVIDLTVLPALLKRFNITGNGICLR